MVGKNHGKCLVTLALFIIVSLTWGTTWLAMKVAVATIPPIFATGLRFLLASPVLITIAKLSGKPLLFPQGKRGFQVALIPAPPGREKTPPSVTYVSRDRWGESGDTRLLSYSLTSPPAT